MIGNISIESNLFRSRAKVVKEFKLTFEEGSSINLGLLQQGMPSNISLENRDGDVYAFFQEDTIEGESVSVLIRRELDRIFFITNVRIKAEAVNYSNGVRIVRRCHESPWKYTDELPINFRRQNWSSKIESQFKLWSLAADVAQTQMKLLLLFQIIELEHPDLGDSEIFPHSFDGKITPLTECKYIRNVISHAVPKGNRIRAYCKSLGYAGDFDGKNDWLGHVLTGRSITLMESEARKILEKAL
ncbi:MAG: hypothetical protein VR73_05180 [Gammaproteobacteria bacterium BRH_c0]|nr:MAG: hypothetical protein VR73_05180 [Gammaproteobacteria bacterium BRH_c0]